MILIKIILILSFLFLLYVNYAANSIPIGGNTTGDISDKYPSIFTPAGFTFSIWGIIYTVFFIYIISIVFKDGSLLIDTNHYYILSIVILSSLLNCLWLYFWHNDKIILSTVVMLSILTTLLLLIKTTSTNDLLPYITFNLYAGWISVATVANISIMLVKLNYKIFMNHQIFWLTTIIIITLIIGVYMTFIQQYYVYGLVFLWAYFGIYSKLNNKNI
jgi:hypothetical protein